MSEVQEIKLWDDWDEIDLSTSERRIERLEILLCQKIHKGEDISQCLEVLQYLKNRTTTERVEAVIFQGVKTKLAFNYWQRIGQAALIYSIAISCCFAMYQLVNSSLSSNSLSELARERQLLKQTSPQSKNITSKGDLGLGKKRKTMFAVKAWNIPVL